MKENLIFCALAALLFCALMLVMGVVMRVGAYLFMLGWSAL